MDTTGLCVAGLDTVGISQKLESYVADCIPRYTLGTGQTMFAESHLFYFDEIKDQLPDEHHHHFTGDEKFVPLAVGSFAVGFKL